MPNSKSISIRCSKSPSKLTRPVTLPVGMNVLFCHQLCLKSAATFYKFLSMILK
ncbi:hypothetical protein Leryth_027073 [Lithospermum erythrorhizon]|nr:hypothetical protein Leryth_027073 [Lithospermum erythrorhizon]